MVTTLSFKALRATLTLTLVGLQAVYAADELDVYLLAGIAQQHAQFHTQSPVGWVGSQL